MVQLLSLFGFLAVLFRGGILAFQSLAIGGVVFYLFVAKSHAGPPLTYRSGRRLIILASLLLSAFEIASILTDTAILVGTANLSLAEAAGANFFVYGAGAACAAILLAGTAWATKAGMPPVALVPCVMILGASLATSHAAARLDDRAVLLVLTFLHQASTATWIGGLPYLLLAAKTSNDVEPWRRFSRLAMGSVVAIVAGGIGMSWFYAGSISGLYGTSYGLMIIAKVTLFGMVLALGALNHRVIRNAAAGASMPAFRLSRLSEVEIGIGFTAILAAASLTSQAPAIDVSTPDRASTADIVARLTPQPPVMTTPPLSSLSPQSRVDFTDTVRAEKFVPFVNYNPPTEGDIAWSEYNHHWAGLVVLVMGILAVLARSGWARWARHWPLAFVGLAVFLLLRADPENWPLGKNGFFESFSAADVTQHRIFVLLILIFAAFEWGVQNKKLKSQTAALVFPAVCAVGGAVLLTHSHAVGNFKEETLIEMTHIPLAIFAVLAGWTRWLEIRLPDFHRRVTASVWPVCFVLIGLSLLLYREH